MINIGASLASIKIVHVFQIPWQYFHLIVVARSDVVQLAFSRLMQDLNLPTVGIHPILFIIFSSVSNHTAYLSITVSRSVIQIRKSR